MKTSTLEAIPIEPSIRILVTWDGDNDTANPQNWPAARKWAITLLTSFGGLVCLISGSMLSPALQTIAEKFDISQAKANMTLSIAILAFAFGPIVLAPLGEVFGRRPVWLACSAWFTIWNMVCGFANSDGLLLAARLLAGLGSSAEFAVSMPVLGDLWSPEQRGHSFAIATFLPLLGPAIGPIIGGFITESIGYRWIFWVLSIFDATLIIIALFVFPETYSQLLLHRKAVALTRETGRQHYTAIDTHSQPLSTRLKNGFLRPYRLLITQPIIQLLSLFLAFNYGMLFFVSASYALIWTNQYHELISQSGLHYIAIVVGSTIASQLGGRLTDLFWKHLTKKSGGETAPEFRVPLMLPGILLIPTGLIWFGWAAQARSYWLVVDVGVAVFSIGIILSTQAMQQYVMESYREQVASAAAASQFLRSIFGFAFPLFAPAVYSHLSYGWGNTTLALVFVVLTVPAPFVLWFLEARLRAKGKAVL